MNGITVLEHLRTCAERAKNHTAKLVGELAKTAAEAIRELAEVKADKGSASAFTIPAEGWNSDDDINYSKYYDIAVPDVTAKDKAEINFVLDSLNIARDCDFCPVSETFDGKIRVRAASVPVEEIAIEYWIENGK